MKNTKSIEEFFLWKLIEKLMKYILVVTSLILIIVVGATVFIRYVLGKDFFGSDEIITLFAMWLYWLGGAYGSYEASHINADVTNLVIKNDYAKKVIEIIVNAFTTAIAGVLMYWSVVYYLAWNIKSGTATPGLHIPMLASNIAITISFCLMFLYSLYHLIRLFVPKVNSEAEIEQLEGVEI